MVICLRMGKNLTAKSPPGDFQVTTPETPLLSQQAVTFMTKVYIYEIGFHKYMMNNLKD